MKSLLAVLVVLGLNSYALAGKDNCTDQPKEKWMSVEAFKEKVTKDGYKIKKFKTPGSCYEIYGYDQKGKKVEIYFNPVDASIVKAEIED